MIRTGKYLLVGFIHYALIILVFKLSSFIIPHSFSCCLTKLLYLALCLVIGFFSFEFTKRKYLNERIEPEGKVILITGCDSGFGHGLAKRLDSRGFHVFASCLIPSGPGAQKLAEQCSDRLRILEMDVTKDESVNQAFKFVKNNLENLELWAVVNNAGIQKGFTTDFASLDDFKDTMEVNGFGMVRVTKAFLPLLKQSRGRIVNVTSSNAKLPTAHNTPYSMSKYAAAGFSECLRLELNAWKIPVIQLEPELLRTQMTDHGEIEKRFDLEVKNVDPEVKAEYGGKYFADLRLAVLQGVTKYGTSDISCVINDLEHAICAIYPDMVYKPCRAYYIKFGIRVVEMLPYVLREQLFKIVSCYLLFPKPQAA